MKQCHRFLHSGRISPMHRLLEDKVHMPTLFSVISGSHPDNLVCWMRPTWPSKKVTQVTQIVRVIRPTFSPCRSTLHLVDDSVPPAPHDLTVARAEKRPYCDSSGNLITPRKESTVHYHCHVSCIKAVEPLFILSSLTIPPEIYTSSYLLGIHTKDI